IVRKILDSYDRLAAENQKHLDALKILGLNLMASPGAGKTSFLLKTIEHLPESIKLGVIEGDTAPVTIDADKIVAQGVPAVQINTGGECHLDAVMTEMALDQLPLKDLDLVIIENVGNLICPAAFALGTHKNILIASIPEGDDKPYKYTNMYRGVDVLIINKIDLLPYLEFRMDYFRQGVAALNPGLVCFELSSKTGEGFDAWMSWLIAEVAKTKAV
ncbi:MAG TPA: hydrogenase nickel incorporation protein HypB, partial [Anaerolineaceae bacterium]|nr:hydrogenase nickel incorporation protein HypB [Anaerolineaceae bacterium]